MQESNLQVDNIYLQMQSMKNIENLFLFDNINSQNLLHFLHNKKF